eukprot:NODE_479_length_863_cov_373.213759_g395_i1.p2 GENE.NODE_479_length_863_cov_373.213759_g395_i1~~NODE_479_length_863_cov_373.213759_g395_i1.p2  ORF type:complete len:193 (-),score=73.12 NODE_479_length_863_cov_373.213759_g395_i1:254-832(-)
MGGGIRLGGMGGMGGMGRMGGMGGMRNRHKGAPYQVGLKCSLQDLYTGTTKKRKITRKRLTQHGTLMDDTKVLEVNVKPGWKAGTKITFEGEGDESTTTSPGDIVFVVEEDSHPLFRRQGDDLHCTVQLKSDEAKCKVILPFLDGTELVVWDGSRPVKSGMEHTIAGKGMPNQKTGKPGNLVVCFAKMAECR